MKTLTAVSLNEWLILWAPCLNFRGWKCFLRSRVSFVNVLKHSARFKTPAVGSWKRPFEMPKLRHPLLTFAPSFACWEIISGRLGALWIIPWLKLILIAGVGPIYQTTELCRPMVFAFCSLWMSSLANPELWKRRDSNPQKTLCLRQSFAQIVRIVVTVS